MLHANSFNYHAPQTAALSLFALLVFVAMTQAAQKQNFEETIYQGGIRNCVGAEGLGNKEIKILLDSLRAKTGWTGLYFDEQGFLTNSEPQNFAGGSGTARRLLQAALESKYQFHLEHRRDAKNITFGRLGAGVHYRHMIKNVFVEIRPLYLDFVDYKFLQGDRDVLESFDVAMVFLHELVHGVHQLKDVEDDPNELGECEQFVNAIRRELLLPERDRYVARTYTVHFGHGVPNKIAELPFIRTKLKNSKYSNETVFLKWDTDRVGSILYQPLTVASAKKKDTSKTTTAVR